MMVLILAGSFEMGDYLDVISNAPVHTVELDAFDMDVNEVMVGQLKKFVQQKYFFVFQRTNCFCWSHFFCFTAPQGSLGKKF